LVDLLALWHCQGWLPCSWWLANGFDDMATAHMASSNIKTVIQLQNASGQMHAQSLQVSVGN
jgi:hypothetical protein